MSERVETIEVAEREAGMRLDRWFRQHFPDVTHGYLQKLLRYGTGARRFEARRGERAPRGGRESPRAPGRAHPARRHAPRANPLMPSPRPTAI